MAHFVLIHGSWHGAWCWHKVVTRLQAYGHTVDAPDLPSHGRDWTRPGEVTLEHYVACVEPFLAAAPAPPVVVAHSRGGIVLSALAERHPERIASAVYLAAVLTPDGQTVFDVAGAGGAESSLILPAMVQAPDGSWDMLREEVFDEALYADCSADDRALCRLLLTPEPLAPSLTPIRTSAARFGRVRKVYIELTEDRTVPLAWQRRMQELVPCDEVRAIAASHSAYLSRPDELAAHLHAIAPRG